MARSNPRKYLNAVEVQYPHMGQLLSNRLRLSGISEAEVARKLLVSGVTVGRYSKSSSLQAGILWNAGMAIKHNFFAEIATFMPVPFSNIEVDNKIAVLQNELIQKQAEINDLAKELAIYKEIVLRSK